MWIASKFGFFLYCRKGRWRASQGQGGERPGRTSGANGAHSASTDLARGGLPLQGYCGSR